MCVCVWVPIWSRMSWNMLEVAWKEGLFVKWAVGSCQLFCDQSIALAVYLCVKRFPAVHFQAFITWFYEVETFNINYFISFYVLCDRWQHIGNELESHRASKRMRNFVHKLHTYAQVRITAPDKESYKVNTVCFHLENPRQLHINCHSYHLQLVFSQLHHLKCI